MGNGKEFSEAMSENGNIQLLSQNGYSSPSSMLAIKSFPIADCCIPLCQRLRWLAFVRTSYNNNWCQCLCWLAFVRTSYIDNWWLSSAWHINSISSSEKVQIFEMPNCLLPQCNGYTKDFASVWQYRRKSWLGKWSEEIWPYSCL